LSAFSRSATLAGGANAITGFIRCSLAAKETSDTTQVFLYSGAAGLSKKHHFSWRVPRFRPFVPLRTALRVQDDEYVAMVLHTDGGNSVLSERRPCGTLSTTNPTCSGPESNMGCCGKAPTR
jgi:hypothetical protein